MKMKWIASVFAAGLLLVGTQAQATTCSSALKNHYVGAAPLDSQSWSAECLMGPPSGTNPTPDTDDIDTLFGVTSTELTSFLTLGPANATSGTWTINLAGIAALYPSYNQFVLAIKDGNLGGTDPTFFYTADLLNYLFQPNTATWSGAWRIGAPIGGGPDAKELSGAYLFGWFDEECCERDVPEPGTLALLGLGLMGLGLSRRRRVLSK